MSRIRDDAGVAYLTSHATIAVSHRHHPLAHRAFGDNSMPTTDIVANLLHLSSEARELGRACWARRSTRLSTATGAEAAADRRAPRRRPGRSRRLAELRPAPCRSISPPRRLERDAVVRRDRWLAAPLDGSRARRCCAADMCRKRKSCRRGRARCADALAIAEQTSSALVRRADRLETILDITHEWHQTNEMETLLVRMAEAATQMFDADRASIFLVGQAEQDDRRPAGARRRRGRAALAGRCGHRRPGGSNRRAAARVPAREDAAEIDRAVDTKTGYRTKTILCVPLVSPRRRAARRVRGAQQARRPVHRRRRARPGRAGRLRRRRARKHAAIRASCSSGRSSWSSRRPRTRCSSARARRFRPCARRSAASPTPIWRF